MASASRCMTPLQARPAWGPPNFLGRERTSSACPPPGRMASRAGVKYWDGQFDDARLALALARTAAARGALLVNYCPAKKLVHELGA